MRKTKRTLDGHPSHPHPQLLPGGGSAPSDHREAGGQCPGSCTAPAALVHSPGFCWARQGRDSSSVSGCNNNTQSRMPDPCIRLPGEGDQSWPGCGQGFCGEQQGQWGPPGPCISNLQFLPHYVLLSANHVLIIQLSICLNSTCCTLEKL